MSDLLEVYVLCGSRSGALAETFLDEFAPRREAASDEFPFPIHSDSSYQLQRPEDVIRRLEIETNRPYSLYWNCVDPSFAVQVMLFFTGDGAMICGIVVPDEQVAIALERMAQTVDGRFGYITSDEPPPDTTEQFVELCRKSSLPALVDGEKRNFVR